jgi:hypothetical protein
MIRKQLEWTTVGEVLKKRPVGRFLISLLAKIPAAILAAEHGSRLAGVAIASGIPVVIAADIAVIVGI